MSSRVGVLVLLVAANLFGADKTSLVQVPSDYGGIEVPVGGFIALKKDLLLPGSSTEAKIYERTSTQDHLTIKQACTLYYNADSQRRKIPAGLQLEVTAVAKNPQSVASGSCWKDGKTREATGVIYSLSAPSGFIAGLYCMTTTGWLASEEYQETDSEGYTSWKTRTITCRHAEIPEVSDMSAELGFWASPDLLEKVIGFQ